MPTKLAYDANNYATLFQQGEEKGFAWFFETLYPALNYYAFKITGNKESSEEPPMLLLKYGKGTSSLPMCYR